MKRKAFFGFTLAEVLITLGIIGIIAALTIPTLIQKQQEMATVSKLKKAYSTLSQAYTLAVQENGTPDNWGLVTGDTTSANNLILLLSKYIKVNPTPVFTEDNGTSYYSLIDGTTIHAYISSSNCIMAPRIDNDGCADIYVDVNGLKPPSKGGEDIFAFNMSKNRGIYPFGIPKDPIFTMEYYYSGSGISATGWVIYNENMDYLHCKDLSWAGKHKCS